MALDSMMLSPLAGFAITLPAVRLCINQSAKLIRSGHATHDGISDRCATAPQRCGRKLAEHLPIVCGKPPRFGEPMPPGNRRDTSIGRVSRAQGMTYQFHPAQTKIADRTHTEILHTPGTQASPRNAKRHTK